MNGKAQTVRLREITPSIVFKERKDGSLLQMEFLKQWIQKHEALKV